MFYTLQITAETDRDLPPCLHRPVSIETYTGRKENVTEAELDVIAEAFKAQVRDLLAAMVHV